MRYKDVRKEVDQRLWGSESVYHVLNINNELLKLKQFLINKKRLNMVLTTYPGKLTLNWFSKNVLKFHRLFNVKLEISQHKKKGAFISVGV